MPRTPETERDRVAGGAALTALLAVAVGLRLWRIGLGLPDFLEEAIPFRLALGMMDVATGRVDWNPHHFNYPSLATYLHFLVQQTVFGIGRLLGAYPSYADYLLSYSIDPTRMVVAARWVGVICDALAVVGVVRLGERFARGAGLLAGFLVATAPILITTSHSIFCDSVMGVLAVWALERMLAWHDQGRQRDLVLASVLVGLAAGAKYPAAVLLLPMAWLIWHRRGWAGFASWAALSGVALVAFVVSTPFAILDSRAFWRDVFFEGAHAAGGHLGSVGHRSFAFHLANLTTNVGWAGALLLLASPALAVVDGRRRPGLVALWIALLGFGAPIALARIDADRYLVPVILFAAPLAAISGWILLGRLPRPGRRFAMGLGLLFLMIPVSLRGVRTAGEGADTTQLQARRWCDAHVGRDELLVQEGYAARLPSSLQVQQVRSEALYRFASPRLRARLDSVRCFHVVALPLAVSGRITSRVEPPGLPPVVWEVFAHAGELNRVFYSPALLADADYVMTSGAVRGRFEADPSRYPVECALYRLLDSKAQVIARFAARGAVIGPEIVVYRIGPRYRDALARGSELDPRWWTEAIPPGYRRRAQELLAPRESATWSATDPAAASPPAWVRSLAGLYAMRIQPFVSDMANELAALGRNEPARAFARATLALRPDDLDAGVVYSVCSGRLGRWGEAREVTARLLAAGGDREAEPALILLHARALERTGDAAGAMRELERLVARVGAGDPVGAQARHMMDRLSAPGGRRG